MLIHPMIEQLQQLKLTGMVTALSEQLQDSAAQALSFEERLGLLVDRQINEQTNRQLRSRLRQAQLRFSEACTSDIDYRSERQLDRSLIARLAMGDWLRQHKNLILTGACGTGKSWLACALAHKACLLGFRARYWRVPRLLEEIALSHVDGRYLKFIKGLSRFHLLILDDWGMSKLTGSHQQDLLEILDDRYQRHATLIAAQLPVEHWHDQIADPTFADAILDRLLGGAYKLEMKGPSLRQKPPDMGENKRVSPTKKSLDQTEEPIG